MRKNVITVLFLVFGLCGGTLLGIGLMFPVVQQATDNADYWNDRHTSLNNSFNDLWDSYVRLWDDYYNLGNSYLDLVADYETLQEAFEEPLTSPVIPTISEVVNWLAIDDTDTLEYTEYWMCGDFSAMLMTRAKTMNWRMRITVVSFSFATNATYKVSTPFGEYGHAFNLIYVQDIPNGDADSNPDVLYIEPQSDNYWVVPNVVDGNYGHYWHYTSDIWRGTVWSGGITSKPHWINYYNYFG